MRVPPDPAHVDAFGGGGVARTVINLANRLAEHRDVRAGQPVPGTFGAALRHPPAGASHRADEDDGDPARHARGARSGGRRWLRPRPAEPRMTRLTDLLLWRRLRALPAGILLTTRPSLHLAAARFAPRGRVTVGQDHSSFPTRFGNPAQAAVLDWPFPASTPTWCSPTPTPTTTGASSRTSRPCVALRDRNALPWQVSAEAGSARRQDRGRRRPARRRKGSRPDGRAFAAVAARHPDWQLHIYGEGAGTTRGRGARHRARPRDAGAAAAATRGPSGPCWRRPRSSR